MTATTETITRPLSYVGAAALIGALSYVFLLGDVERIVLE